MEKVIVKNWKVSEGADSVLADMGVDSHTFMGFMSKTKSYVNNALERLIAINSEIVSTALISGDYIAFPLFGMGLIAATKIVRTPDGVEAFIALISEQENN